MRKILLLFPFLLLIIPITTIAQTRTVIGTVRDIGGVLPGASVIEKGQTTNGVVTDANGKFTLTLRGQSNTVVVRFVG
ncbi:MAG: hypothetical protein EOP41_10645, partial [Sphingobacteriaceae bacterium]